MRGLNIRQVVIWSTIAILGAVAWGFVALARGEQINAIWLIFAALCSYAIAYRFYARDMHAVVTNSTVDGVLAAFFALMIITVILDASRIWIKAIRAREPLPTTETPPEPSLIWAPSGLIPTAAERQRARREPAVAGVGKRR